jgi:hypothetical protein
MRITLIGIDYISKIYCPDPHISVIFKQDTNLRPETMTPVYVTIQQCAQRPVRQKPIDQGYTLEMTIYPTIAATHLRHLKITHGIGPGKSFLTSKQVPRFPHEACIYAHGST